MAKRPVVRVSTPEAEFHRGVEKVYSSPVFRPLVALVEVQRVMPQEVGMPGDAWALLDLRGNGRPVVYANARINSHSSKWAYVIAHHLLHLGFGHHMGPAGDLWNVVCDIVVASFLKDIDFELKPVEITLPKDDLPATEAALYAHFLALGTIGGIDRGAGVGGHAPDMRGRRDPPKGGPSHSIYRAALAAGLADGVRSALVNIRDKPESEDGKPPTQAMKARSWFMAAFPLLGSLATSFRLEEDPRLCQVHQVGVAAVDPSQQVIYVNPGARLSGSELRFVLGHELLHVGLRHSERAAGRDPFLWNVACDYVVNDWLLEMRVGTMPKIGALHDPELRGLSAEQIYDRVATDLRRIRKLATLRGIGLGDMLAPPDARFWETQEGLRLDEFYRAVLAQGLEHQLALSGGRGTLPASLVEEIRALQLPPIPWDVRLGRWFDEQFPPLERQRSYTRLSRRQGATPDIPRPSTRLPPAVREGRTFAVVVDTSGSMSSRLLGYALGAIAGYALAKEVGLVRLIFCDAAPYDQGYVNPESLTGRVEVRGRGGTVLQPAIDLLESVSDFPADGPVLVITDGFIESSLTVRRNHAYLLPPGGRLPFAAKGPLFFVEEG